MSAECGNCQCFRPGAAEGFKPDGDGSLAKLHLANWLSEQKKQAQAWPGECWEGPEVRSVFSNRWCSRWRPDRWFVVTINDRAGFRTTQDELVRVKQELARARKRWRAKAGLGK